MKKLLLTFLAATFVLASSMIAGAQDKTAINNQLDKSAQLIQEMTASNANNAIPRKVIEDAKCIAVVPGLKQAGLIVGGRHGDGVATCKTSTGHWSPPAPFSLSGGSLGLQAGAQSSDLVMMVMNQQGVQALESGHFKVGGEVSGVAGPVGRDASPETTTSKAAILTYARTKGVYGGVTVNGAELSENKKETNSLYGSDVPFAQILHGQAPRTNDPAVHQFLATIHSAEATAHAQ